MSIFVQLLIAVLIAVCVIVIGALDVVCFVKASYDVRTGHWWSYWFGSGFYALWLTQSESRFDV